jgi:hypothetical protein
MQKGSEANPMDLLLVADNSRANRTPVRMPDLQLVAASRAASVEIRADAIVI